jgi:peptidylprolyl isomerase
LRHEVSPPRPTSPKIHAIRRQKLSRKTLELSYTSVTMTFNHKSALILVLAFSTAAFTAASAAQTATTPKKPATATTAPHSTTAPHTAAAPAASAAACVKLPELSPKVPALPPGLPCAKPLYTVSTVPAVKLDYVSPLEGPGLRETLGIEPSSFSLAYVDTKVGTGELAAPHKWYSIHYTGYLVDGTKFDSSVDRGEPISINYGQHQVIPGWDTGFDGMHVGGKRRLFIPFQLAYGATAHGPIPARSELIFDVELVAQSDTQPAPPAPKTPAAAKPTDQPSTSAPAATDPTKPAAEPAKPATEPTKPNSTPN